MAVQLLVGTAIMVALLVAVFMVATRGRAWYRYTPQTSRDIGWTPALEGETAGGSVLSNPITWIVAFFLTIVAVIVGVFLFATGSLGGSATMLLGGVGALVLVYLVGGTYLMARQRGHSSAAAVFESATASGAVFLLLVVVQLVFLG